MNESLNRWIEITFTLVLVFLILSRATGFSSIVRTAAGGYVEAVKALQGR